ncbi:hypothetical protein PPACK8108_LOCUS24527 [Phakopsora pachyrhizi]|uniref:Uncharacterized protein n=1 Tax=Phakopsora pachyrhizi TaxID=170000 RepID=A0AAV0BS66_PHAPC|nr:hypothetical protein PPACK8108_LOCUS24527 [Phakopsora pachyrhizi]
MAYLKGSTVIAMSTMGSANEPAGFGGQDCGQPVCGSLADGDKRHVRPENSTSCDCDKGWTSVNFNVCKNDDSCAALIPPYSPGKLLVQISDPQKNRSEAVCCKGGFAVNKTIRCATLPEDYLRSPSCVIYQLLHVSSNSE